MSPGQLDPRHWTSAEFPEQQGKCLQNNPSPPPPLSSSQNSARCGGRSAPLCQLGVRALCLFKGSLALIVTVPCGKASEKPRPLTWHKGRKSPMPPWPGRDGERGQDS